MPEDREWEQEPDRVEFVHAGLHCLVLRNSMKALCGYVGVPPEHPWFQKRYNQCLEGCPPDNRREREEHMKELPGISDDTAKSLSEFLHWSCTWDSDLQHRSPELQISVHGGITWSEMGEGGELRPEGLWWFGFDCAHFMDYVPGLNEALGRRRLLADGEYRNIEYVTSECKRLAEQLAAVVITKNISDIPAPFKIAFGEQESTDQGGDNAVS